MLTIPYKDRKILIIRHFREINIVIERNEILKEYSFSWFWMWKPSVWSWREQLKTKCWYWKPKTANIDYHDGTKCYRVDFLGFEYRKWAPIHKKAWSKICEESLGVGKPYE